MCSMTRIVQCSIEGTHSGHMCMTHLNTDSLISTHSTLARNPLMSTVLHSTQRGKVQALWQRTDDLWSSLLSLCLNLFIPALSWAWLVAHSQAVCVCIFILPAGSNLRVKGSPLLLHKQRLWDEIHTASWLNAWAWLLATAPCRVHLRHLPGHHAGPGN